MRTSDNNLIKDLYSILISPTKSIVLSGEQKEKSLVLKGLQESRNQIAYLENQDYLIISYLDCKVLPLDISTNQFWHSVIKSFINMPQINLDASKILNKLIDRTKTNFIQPDKDYEKVGEVNEVCFVEGLVFFKKKWFLYYGTADSKIAVAVKE